jgi:hypothetical protein
MRNAPRKIAILCIACVVILYCLTSVHTETLSIRLSKAERDTMRRRAKQEKISQGDLVRRALRAYGVTPEPGREKTGFDVVGRLIGRNRGGPRDLSSNPAHLADYGR